MDLFMEAREQIRVMVVDDHPAVRETLATFINSLSDMELAGLAATGPEAIELCGEAAPDVILMDLVMPEMDGIDTSRAILRAFPDTRIIVLSSFGNTTLVEAATAAGAVAYLSKNSPIESLADAIRTATYQQ